MPRKPATPGTAQRILDIAERLLQTRGYNGFSYADIAAALAVTKASLHYHFPTKPDLAVALVRRYREAVGEAMADIAVTKKTVADRLDATVRLYTDTLNNEARICICAALAGEYWSLPREV